jgi:hypothetical protein
MTGLRRNLIAVCLLVSFASAAAAGFFLLRRYSGIPLDPHLVPPAQAEEMNQILPVQLVIPDQRIDVSITPAQLHNREWQLSNHGVSLLQHGAPRKDAGLIIYGHNWRSLLGNLQQAKIGGKINLIYGDGNVEQYTVQSMLTVSPDRLDVLDLAKPDTLLIYTCTGFLDGQRLVVLAHK